MKATRFCGLSQDLFWLAPAGATSAEILAARPSALLCSKRARSLSLLCRILLGNLEEGRHQNAEPKASFSPATDTGVREPRKSPPVFSLYFPLGGVCFLHGEVEKHSISCRRLSDEETVLWRANVSWLQGRLSSESLREGQGDMKRF